MANVKQTYSEDIDFGLFVLKLYRSTGLDESRPLTDAESTAMRREASSKGINLDMVRQWIAYGSQKLGISEGEFILVNVPYFFGPSQVVKVGHSTSISRTTLDASNEVLKMRSQGTGTVASSSKAALEQSERSLAEIYDYLTEHAQQFAATDSSGDFFTHWLTRSNRVYYSDVDVLDLYRRVLGNDYVDRVLVPLLSTRVPLEGRGFNEFLKSVRLQIKKGNDLAQVDLEEVAEYFGNLARTNVRQAMDQFCDVLLGDVVKEASDRSKTKILDTVIDQFFQQKLSYPDWHYVYKKLLGSVPGFVFPQSLLEQLDTDVLVSYAQQMLADYESDAPDYLLEVLNSRFNRMKSFNKKLDLATSLLGSVSGDVSRLEALGRTIQAYFGSLEDSSRIVEVVDAFYSRGLGSSIPPSLSTKYGKSLVRSAYQRRTLEDPSSSVVPYLQLQLEFLQNSGRVPPRELAQEIENVRSRIRRMFGGDPSQFFGIQPTVPSVVESVDDEAWRQVVTTGELALDAELASSVRNFFESSRSEIERTSKIESAAERTPIAAQLANSETDLKNQLEMRRATVSSSPSLTSLILSTARNLQTNRQRIQAERQTRQQAPATGIFQPIDRFTIPPMTEKSLTVKPRRT